MWQVLIGAAHQNTTVTYSELGGLVGLEPRNVGTYLCMLQDYCADDELPPLPVLVVQKMTCQPGLGIGDIDVEAAQKAVIDLPGIAARR